MARVNAHVRNHLFFDGRAGRQTAFANPNGLHFPAEELKVFGLPGCCASYFVPGNLIFWIESPGCWAYAFFQRDLGSWGDSHTPSTLFFSRFLCIVSCCREVWGSREPLIPPSLPRCARSLEALPTHTRQLRLLKHGPGLTRVRSGGKRP